MSIAKRNWATICLYLLGSKFWPKAQYRPLRKQPLSSFLGAHAFRSLSLSLTRMASSSLSSLSSVLNQQHCIKLPKRCSILTLRFFSSKPCGSISTSAARIFCRHRARCRSSASAFSHSISRSFSHSHYPVSSGGNFSENPSLHHFMPKATAAVTDATVSDPQLE